MTREYQYGQLRLVSRGRSSRDMQAVERRGTPTVGHISALLVGQGTGFIQSGSDCKTFFHRNDVQLGTSINDLNVGDLVEFDLVEDPVSGARALCVRRTTIG